MDRMAGELATTEDGRHGRHGSGTVMRVTVRYFAGARAAAGTAEEPLQLGPGATVQQLVDALAAEHGPDLARVLAACTFLVEETAAGRDRVLADGAQVDVLPPFAGG